MFEQYLIDKRYGRTKSLTHLAERPLDGCHVSCNSGVDFEHLRPHENMADGTPSLPERFQLVIYLRESVGV